jgi:type I restriction enzyme S subunit
VNKARLKDVTEFVLDGTHGSPVRTEVGVPVLSAQNVKDGRLNFETDRYTTAAEYDEFKKRLPLAVGDVLLTIVGTIGRAAVVDETRPLVFQRSVAVIRPRRDALWPRFLYHVSQSWDFQAQLSRSSNQSSQAGVYLGKLKELRIPLPPLPEQRRIAEILDKADALQAKRRAALAQLDSLTHSIFLDMFGDPVTNPKGWPERHFDETMRDETSRSEKLQQSEFLPAGRFPVVDQGQADIAGYCDDPRYLCQSTVPVVVFGDHTRAVKLVREPFVIGADGAKVLVPQQGIGAELLSWLLRLAPIPTLGYSRHMRAVKRLKFPVPPMDLQRNFSRRIAMIDKVKATQRASMADLETLFTSLQHRAFRGEL